MASARPNRGSDGLIPQLRTFSGASPRQDFPAELGGRDGRPSYRAAAHSPSALVAALAAAVLEASERRLGRRSSGMFGPVSRDQVGNPSDTVAGSSHRDIPLLPLLAGGRGSGGEP